MANSTKTSHGRAVFKKSPAARAGLSTERPHRLNHPSGYSPRAGTGTTGARRVPVVVPPQQVLDGAREFGHPVGLLDQPRARDLAIDAGRIRIARDEKHGASPGTCPSLALIATAFGANPKHNAAGLRGAWGWPKTTAGGLSGVGLWQPISNVLRAVRAEHVPPTSGTLPRTTIRRQSQLPRYSQETSVQIGVQRWLPRYSEATKTGNSRSAEVRVLVLGWRNGASPGSQFRFLSYALRPWPALARRGDWRPKKV
jgi:hypothetical protein